MNVFASAIMLDSITNKTLCFNYFNTIYYFLLALQSNEPIHGSTMSFHVMPQGPRLLVFQVLYIQ